MWLQWIRTDILVWFEDKQVIGLFHLCNPYSGFSAPPPALFGSDPLWAGVESSVGVWVGEVNVSLTLSNDPQHSVSEMSFVFFYRAAGGVRLSVLSPFDLKEMNADTASPVLM